MIALAFALAVGAAQKFETEPLAILGIGRLDCATAFRPENRAETSTWIIGFWTGRNAARLTSDGRRTQVGRNLGENGVVAEVERRCQKEPTSTMAAIADLTFDRLARGL